MSIFDSLPTVGHRKEEAVKRNRATFGEVSTQLVFIVAGMQMNLKRGLIREEFIKEFGESYGAHFSKRWNHAKELAEWMSEKNILIYAK